MKIIFCDIDGVLATPRTIPLREVFIESADERIGFNRLDTACVEQLNRITEATGAKIVISSSWRQECATINRFGMLCQHLNNEGVTGEIIDRTPVPEEYSKGDVHSFFVFAQPRGNEIQMWLDKNEHVGSFVILDDLSDMEHLSGRLIQTQFESGITAFESDMAISMLTYS